jgi:hypothetical protein
MVTFAWSSGQARDLGAVAWTRKVDELDEGREANAGTARRPVGDDPDVSMPSAWLSDSHAHPIPCEFIVMDRNCTSASAWRSQPARP